MTDQAEEGRPRQLPSREQLDVILRAFDDARNLIAAGKVQRWEVAKWTVTLNVALAAAAAAFRSRPNASSALILAIAIALLGVLLIIQYNRRMTRARDRLGRLHRYLNKNVVDLDALTGAAYAPRKGPTYDSTELILFILICGLSFLPAYFVWNHMN